VLIGLPSTGLHTNGYSLARKIAFEVLGLTVDSYVPDLGKTVGDALLQPHRSYLPVIRPLLSGGLIKGMAHITGGGITDNFPRILPVGTAATVDTNAWEVPPIFRWLERSGTVPRDDMWRTFNMGIGLIVVSRPDRANTLVAELVANGERAACVIGEVIPGQLCNVTYR
jgi:phosphoribosylformylglycinamidine cyclo-ligase